MAAGVARRQRPLDGPGMFGPTMGGELAPGELVITPTHSQPQPDSRFRTRSGTGGDVVAVSPVGGGEEDAGVNNDHTSPAVLVTWVSPMT